MLHKARYHVSFFCNERPRNWRERVGEVLRDAADLLDGRASLAVQMSSDPQLSAEVQRDVLLKGMEHMARCFKDAVADECREELLREVRPDLFASEAGSAHSPRGDA